MHNIINGFDLNTIYLEHIWDETCRCLEGVYHITANNETKNLNILKFEGTIEIMNQFAEITEVTSCSNMTAVYADIWDGTNSKLLTKNTADFSGLTVGSFFSKVEDNSVEYLLHISNENRMYEGATKNLYNPFYITAKQGVDNYIRFNFTTNTNLDFKMRIHFDWKPIDGGKVYVV